MIRHAGFHLHLWKITAAFVKKHVHLGYLGLTGYHILNYFSKNLFYFGGDCFCFELHIGDGNSSLEILFKKAYRFYLFIFLGINLFEKR